MSLLDDQLAEVSERRARCLDLLARCLIEIDSCSQRLDILLDRKLAGDGALIDPDVMA